MYACVFVFAVPGVAPAQTPGDDQYADPFGGAQDEGAPPDSGEEPAPVPTAAPAEPAAPAAGGEASAPAPAPDPAPEANAVQQLPYTGADAEIILATGTVLLAGGVALRLRVRT